MMKLKKSFGFTLIELMVVVAIIGLLALLGLRLYTGQQEKAKDAILRANVSTVHTNIQTQLTDNNADDVWGQIDTIIQNAVIHIPGSTQQDGNVAGVTDAAPGYSGNGGWVFVYVDDDSSPTTFYVNGVNFDEDDYVLSTNLIAKK